MKTRAPFLVPVLALLACAAKTNAPVEVVAICNPPDDPAACGFSVPCDEQYIGFNVLDTSRSNALWLVLQVDNQAVDNTNTGTGSVNTHDAFVSEARVKYEGAPVPESISGILGSGFVPAEGTSAVSVLAIDETVGDVFTGLLAPGAAVDVRAHLRLRGHYADTTSFETGDYDLTIRVCNGCLAGVVPTGCVDPTEVLNVCPKQGQLPASFECAAP